MKKRERDNRIGLTISCERRRHYAYYDYNTYDDCVRFSLLLGQVKPCVGLTIGRMCNRCDLVGISEWGMAYRKRESVPGAIHNRFHLASNRIHTFRLRWKSTFMS